MGDTQGGGIYQGIHDLANVVFIFIGSTEVETMPIMSSMWSKDGPQHLTVAPFFYGSPSLSDAAYTLCYGDDYIVDGLHRAGEA